MPLRSLIAFALLFATLAIRPALAVEGEVGTFPAEPVSGEAFHVLHYKDVAAAKLAADEKLPPPEFKYQWMVTVKEGTDVFTPRVSGVPAKPPAVPVLKVTKARPGATYTFVLRRTDSANETREYKLVVDFGEDGAKATFPAVEMEPMAPMNPPAGSSPPPRPDGDDPFGEPRPRAALHESPPPPAPAGSPPPADPAVLPPNPAVVPADPAMVPVDPSVVPAVPSAAPVDPAVALATGPIVAQEFWSIETAKDTGIYGVNEPSILEAARIVSDQFEEAATLLRGTTPEKAAKIALNRSKLIVGALNGKGGRDESMTFVWENFFNAWFAKVTEKSRPLKGKDKQDLLARAFEEASQEIMKLGDLINTEQDTATNKPPINNAGSRGSVGGAAGSSFIGTGYLPHHIRWRMKRNAVLQAKINSYRGR